MASRPLRWQLFPSYLLTALFVLIAGGLYSIPSFRSFYLRQKGEDLIRTVAALQPQFKGLFKRRSQEAVDALCKKTRARLGIRVTAVLPDGTVIGDSHKDPLSMDNHAGRPEIVEAVKVGRGYSTRYSATVGTQMMYGALPVKDGREILGVLRGAVPLQEINMQLQKIVHTVFWGALVIVFFSVGLSFFIAWRLSAPLERIRRGAKSFARGDLKRRLPVSGSAEVQDLAKALNMMAQALSEKIKTITLQKEELAAVLESMREGVLSISADNTILSANTAAGKHLDIPVPHCCGKKVYEVIRNSEISGFIEDLVSGCDSVPLQATVITEKGRVLELYGARPRSEDSGSGAAVLVLGDVTRLKALEKVKKDFVANVSHELKTPVSAIKGFVETLIDGAADDPESLKRFLKIISDHSDRLERIIEDLLTLSRLEAEGDKGNIELQPVNLHSLLERALAFTSYKADVKGITLSASCGRELRASLNEDLILQALINLIDNAIKYNREGGRVDVSAGAGEDNLVIKVKDTGMGIENRHLDRIFERFYTPDKAGSRERGGTGLGLSIVKHVVELHGGRVCVESTVGKGSVFIVSLPGFRIS